MQRRRFDHLIVEISVALDRSLPRYPLWLTLKDLGMEPERLTREAAIAFCDNHLQEFLAHLGYRLSPRRHKRLLRTVARFDPAQITPTERMARI
ncbi:MAG: hypothetical protein ACE5FL_09600 [Myxococcota bacterium]